MIKHVLKRFKQGKNIVSTPLPDVLIHIGAPKCGSSAIQRFCISNRKILLEMGYYYPEHTLDSNGVSGGHSQIASALLNNKQEQAASTFKRWIKEAKAYKACLLLSAEAFYGQYVAMAKLCDGMNVQVLAFLRNPVEYLLANHNQGIKRHMGTKRLTELLPEVLGRPTAHLAGLPLLHWADIFGDENCNFIPYLSPSNGGEPIQVRLLQALNLPEVQIRKLVNDVEKITNRSYVKSALELKRLLNTVLDDLPIDISHQVDWSMQEYSDRSINERCYEASELSNETRELLERHLLKQMRPVVKRFPQLNAVAEIGLIENGHKNAAWLNLETPLSALKNDYPLAYNAIIKRAIELRNHGRKDYAFCKLLDVLGIVFQESKEDKSISGLTSSQKEILKSGGLKEADCLREMAVLLERQGLLEDALFTIECALAKRPEGTGIQKIKARIEEKLRLTASISSGTNAPISELNKLRSGK